MWVEPGLTECKADPSPLSYLSSSLFLCWATPHAAQGLLLALSGVTPGGPGGPSEVPGISPGSAAFKASACPCPMALASFCFLRGHTESLRVREGEPLLERLRVTRIRRRRGGTPASLHKARTVLAPRPQPSPWPLILSPKPDFSCLFKQSVCLPLSRTFLGWRSSGWALALHSGPGWSPEPCERQSLSTTW